LNSRKTDELLQVPRIVLEVEQPTAKVKYDVTHTKDFAHQRKSFPIISRQLEVWIHLVLKLWTFFTIIHELYKAIDTLVTDTFIQL